MKRTFAIGAALSLPLALGVAAPAVAAPSDNGFCVQQGIAKLKSLGLLQAAAQQKVDYSALADPVAGPIFTTLPAGSFLSLGQVVKLHTTNPELFAWCAR